MLFIMKERERNIIFDLGGVILNINEELTISEFKKLLKPNIAFSRENAMFFDITCRMETGQLDQQAFFDALKPFINERVEPAQLVDAWCAMLLDIPENRVKMIKSLSHEASLFLLSNTDPLHIAEYEADFLYRYGFPLASLFDTVFYSSDMGIRKPLPESFQYVLDKTGAHANETLFIDDREENCKAAARLGMTTIQVPACTGLEAVIDQVVEWLKK
jgi:glucose-1-phosphatase